MTDRFYQAIRNDDLTALRTLIQQNGPNVKTTRGQTPLMFAAAYGSLDAFGMLLSSGADLDVEERRCRAVEWSP